MTERQNMGEMYAGRPLIYLPDLDSAEEYQGCYVKVPEHNFAIYVAKMDDEGLPILPPNWYEDVK